MEHTDKPILLAIDSSPLGEGLSVTRHLTDEFVTQWRHRHPEGWVIRRDLATLQLAPLDAEWIGAAYTPPDQLTARQQVVLARSNELIAELETAQEYVIGVPMHNFSIPGTLKLWIDQVARAGKTFSYANGTPEGLLHGKKATFLVASGGVYDSGSPAAAMNFVEPYLRTLFGFLGIGETSFINAGGVARLRSGVARETILRPALASIHSQMKAA